MLYNGYVLSCFAHTWIFGGNFTCTKRVIDWFLRSRQSQASSFWAWWGCTFRWQKTTWLDLMRCGSAGWIRSATQKGQDTCIWLLFNGLWSYHNYVFWCTHAGGHYMRACSVLTLFYCTCAFGQIAQHETTGLVIVHLIRYQARCSIKFDGQQLANFALKVQTVRW